MIKSYLTKVSIGASLVLMALLAMPFVGRYFGVSDSTYSKYFINYYLNYKFLENCGEFLNFDQIAKLQTENPTFSIYGSPIRGDFYNYKLALYKRTLPKIVSIGSSRVMQFRQRFFDKPFVNMGGAMNSIDMGEHLVKDILSISPPEHVIIGIDFWWFNENFEKPQVTQVAPKIVSPRNVGNIKEVQKWICDGKVSLARFLYVLSPFNDYMNSGRIGVEATIKGDGFGPDGSRYYTNRITHLQNNGDVKFDDTFNRIHQGKSRFEYGESISDFQFQRFLKLLNQLHSHGIKTTIFIPPLAPSVVAEMEKWGDKYLFIDKLKDKLKKSGIIFYDFQDPSTLETNDCEFVDGFHGGDLTYAKILLNIVATTTNKHLASYLDMDYLNDVAGKYHGIAMIPDKRVTSLPEVDFLNMGCKKQSLNDSLQVNVSKL